MNEDSPSGTDDSEANSESVLNEDTSSTFGLNKEVLELIALFGSLCIGALLGLGFLIRGELMLAGIFFFDRLGYTGAPCSKRKLKKQTTQQAFFLNQGVPRL